MAEDGFELEIYCRECRGNGVVCDDRDELTECDACDGLGLVPTKLGEKVLDLMRRHFDSLHRSAHLGD